MRRRTFVGCACSALSLTPNAKQANGRLACQISNENFELLLDSGAPTFSSIWEKAPVLFRSGNQDFDRALGRALVRLSIEFNVSPAFGYVEDKAIGNAIATSQSRFLNTQGTVLFELNYLRGFLNEVDDGDVVILGICAHEFGHISQYFGGAYEFLRASHHTVKLVELHADYLAGYFMALLKRDRPTLKLRSFGRAFFELGTYDREDPGFHGTPDERLQAVEAGYFSGPSLRDFHSAYKTGIKFVTSEFGRK